MCQLGESRRNPMPADQNAPFKLGDFGYFRSNFAESRSAEERHRHCTSWAQGMFSLVSKSLLACVIASFALLSSGQARAQTGGTGGTISGTGGTTASPIAATDFTMYFESYNKDQGKWIQMNSTDASIFFNQAHCLCGEDQSAEFKVLIETGTGVYQKITNLLESVNSANTGQGYGRLLVGKGGTDCLVANDANVNNLDGFCTNLEYPDSSYLSNFFLMSTVANYGHYESLPIPVARLFGAYNGCTSSQSCDSTTNCTLPSAQISIQFWAQTQTQTTTAPDFDGQISGGTISLVTSVSVVPTDIIVQGGNEALAVNWDFGSTSVSSDTTLNGVQIFCRRGASYQVYADGTFSAYYQSPADVCQASAPPQPAGTDPLTQDDRYYLCSGLIPPTTQTYRITGLQNGITYGVAIAAVDKYDNIGPLSSISYGTPIPTVDFYSDYRKDGGVAPGGFCALAGWQKRGSALVTIGMVGLALIAVRRRRWKRRPPGSGGLALLIVGGTLAASAGQARAQAVYPERTSYGDLEDSEPWNGSPREFAIEARFGLYTPNVDSEFSGQPPPPGSKTPPQPNALVFGTQKRPMWQFEFDWEFLQEFGTLSPSAASIGYYKENARPAISSGWFADPNCTRCAERARRQHQPAPHSAGGAAGLPHGRSRQSLEHPARALRERSGSTTPSGPSPTATATCVVYAGNSKGQGGTMGWQAAVGLSLQPRFSRSGRRARFRCGLGREPHLRLLRARPHRRLRPLPQGRLRVGDNTWFAGLMFEF
jgi:hypothetical protein